MFDLYAAQQRCGNGSHPGHDSSRLLRFRSCFLSSRLMLGLAMTLLGASSGMAAAPLAGSRSGPLQCVPFARALSGITIHGDAATWWKQAEHLFERGGRPKVGAVLAFKATTAMPRGHVAVVDAVLDDRHILLDHANWSQPGLIEQGVLAADVSPAGDWSEVRVWYAPVHGLGSRESPTYGFIYAPATSDGAQSQGSLADNTETPVALERAAG